MKRLVTLLTLALAATLLGSQLWADSDTPVGKWRQIDDETGEPKSVVRIYHDDGVLEGKIIKLLELPEPGEPVSAVCDLCKGDLKDAPILGFRLISGMTQDGDEWTGGTIVDPENGTEYKAKLSLSDGGQKLWVRGYIGIALFGRTQVWERIE